MTSLSLAACSVRGSGAAEGAGGRSVPLGLCTRGCGRAVINGVEFYGHCSFCDKA